MRPADFERSQREGFAGYFGKPVDPNDLERKIAELLAGAAPAAKP